jgi:hypothetical protein
LVGVGFADAGGLIDPALVTGAFFVLAISVSVRAKP